MKRIDKTNYYLDMAEVALERGTCLRRNFGAVIVKNDEDNILISIKDTGIDFNPVVENDSLEFDNISVLNKIADKIDYSRVLGLNSTVITIKN